MEDFDLSKIISEFVKAQTDEIIEIGKQVFQQKADHIRLKLPQTYEEYLRKLSDQYSYTKSLLNRTDPLFLYDLYEPLSVRIHNKLISNPDIGDLGSSPWGVVLSGTAGSGKSMFMRHLLLSSISDQNKVPLFFEMRQLNQGSDDLYTLVTQTLRRHNFALRDDYIEEALLHGHFAILMDGFDEIKPDLQNSFINDLQEFSDRYADNWIILSTRPGNNVYSLRNFTTARLCSLNFEAAYNLVDKAPISQEIKDKFLNDFDEDLFAEHKEFLSNPLLLTIMLLTYSQSARIPDKLHQFYKQAYQALFESHDALKPGFQRYRRTNLDLQDFGKVFSGFSLQTYDVGETEFREADALAYLKETQYIVDVDFDVKNYLDDAIQAVGLLIEDGLIILYAHRSFQEYFAAEYIANIAERGIQSRLIDRYASLENQITFLQLLFDIAPEVVKLHLIAPQIDKILKAADITPPVDLETYQRFLAHILDSIKFDEGGPTLLFRHMKDLNVCNLVYNNLASFGLSLADAGSSVTDFYEKYGAIQADEAGVTYEEGGSGSYLTTKIVPQILPTDSEIFDDFARVNTSISLEMLQLLIEVREIIELDQQRRAEYLSELFDL